MSTETGSCCFCCSLTQGTIGTGIFFSFEALMKIAHGVYLLHKLNNYCDPTTCVYEQKEVEIFYLEHDPTGWHYIIIGAFFILLNILLFVAVATHHPKYLIPWLGCMLIRLTALIISHLYNVFMMIVHPLTIVLITADILLMVYLYTVVYSYYRSLYRSPPHFPIAVSNLNTETSFVEPIYVVQPPPMASGYVPVPIDDLNNKNQPPRYQQTLTNVTYSFPNPHQEATFML